ncbi:unnamed protein product [Meloidogyne enterolobii]|uniref:Uncharacterized protein n=1 Tax=Meloidogyne enterolobii TaxID=390850 RepID=A0ACB0Z6I0_MELEN
MHIWSEDRPAISEEITGAFLPSDLRRDHWCFFAQRSPKRSLVLLLLLLLKCCLPSDLRRDHWCFCCCCC